MNLKDQLWRVVAALTNAKIDYALCGGIAVVIHGYPRLTRDIDILIREVNLELVCAALKDIGFTIATGVILFDWGKPTERRVFRVTRFDGEDHLSVDLIVVTPFLEAAWADRETHMVEGMLLHVVSRAGLALMKRAAGRPQDLADLSELGLIPPSP